MQGNNLNDADYVRHIKTLVNGPPKQRRQAIKELIADTSNRKKILDNIEVVIKKQSAVLYDDSKPKEPRNGMEHKAMIEASLIEQAAIQTALGILGPDGLLDDKQPFVKLIDHSGMLERLGRWEHHVKLMNERAPEIVEQFRKNRKRKDIKYVAIFGLGGSGAPHDIAENIISNWRKSSVRIEVIHADTPNPDYIDKNTLAIFSSFSGNTEEIIECYKTVRPKTDMRVVLTKGGKLGQIAKRDRIPFIQLPVEETHPAYVKQPRESVCLQLTAILTFLGSIGLKPGLKGSLTLEGLAFANKVIPLIGEWRQRFGPEVPYKDNPAKRLAFFLLYGIDYKGEGNLRKDDLWQKKIPCILVDRNNWAIGHEIRTQLHERSKVNAIFYEAPEFLHNLVESIRAGVESSQGGLDENPFVYYFIRSLDEERRIRLRLDKTIELVIKGKGRYATLNAEGENPFLRALFAVYFNAHMATYLALLNGFDPLPVPTMYWIKNVMRGFKRNGKEEKKAQITDRPLLTLNCSE
jgi:D-arabinose 5-phosphate isomerase GutQ